MNTPEWIITGGVGLMIGLCVAILIYLVRHKELA